MARTRLYLDIDGVINAQMPLGWGSTMNGIAVAEGDPYKIRWAPTLIDALNALDVDIWVVSTWRDHAVENLFPLVGLREPAGVLHPGSDPRNQTPYFEPSINWKVPAIIQHQQEDPSPFIHVDDEALDHAGWREMASEMYDGFVIAPKSHMGITPDQIKHIQLFLEEVSMRGDSATI